MIITTRRIRRTHCLDCGVELSDANAYRKNRRTRGWRSRCRLCSARHRRQVHDRHEDERRALVTREACDICGATETLTRNGQVRRPTLDHDHQTGAWRGLLCSRCNTGLGHFRDDPALLRSAAAYIENPPGLELAA